MRYRPRLGRALGGPPGLFREHPIVLRVVGQLGEPEGLEQRRHVDAEASTKSLLEPVPAADGIVGRTAPGRGVDVEMGDRGAWRLTWSAASISRRRRAKTPPHRSPRTIAAVPVAAMVRQRLPPGWRLRISSGSRGSEGRSAEAIAQPDT